MSINRRLYAPPVPKMPSGLVELMDGLARDVLKNNPQNIYEFCAHHMQRLLEIRDGSAPKILTLDEKIAKAQKKVNQRAEQRRHAYDKKILLMSTIASKAQEDVKPCDAVSDLKYTETKEIEKQVLTSAVGNIEVVEKTITNINNQEGDLHTYSEDEIKENQENVDNTIQEASNLFNSDDCNSSLNNETLGNDILEDQANDGIVVNAISYTVDTNVIPENLNDPQPIVTETDTVDSAVLSQINDMEEEIQLNSGLQEANDTSEDNNLIQENHVDFQSTLNDGEPVVSAVPSEIKDGADEQEIIQQDSTHHQANDISDDIDTNLAKDTTEINDTGYIVDSNVMLEDHVDIQSNVADTDGFAEPSTIKEMQGKNKQQDSTDSHCNTRVHNVINDDKKEESDVTALVDNNAIEKPTSAITNFSTNTTQDSPSITNALGLNSDGHGNILSDESKICSSENVTDDLSESKKLHDDDKILAVILDTQNLEHAVGSGQNNELENDEKIKSMLISDQNNDLVKSVAKEVTENTDPKRVPELTTDKSLNNNCSMDLETAAITIQKVFRSFLFKTKTASYDDPTTVDINLLNEDKDKEETEMLNLKDRRPLGISRMDTVLQTVNEEKSLSLSTDDSSTLSSAATIIQAHVRGYLVRNKLNLNKTTSTNSLLDSDAPSIPSLEGESDNRKSKTVLNIHIVPEGGHFVSRDESIMTSMDLSLDSSPPSSVNLHPLGYDKSERRKQLKREDAIQSVSPPSNNSGKLSDELDSVKEILVVGTDSKPQQAINNIKIEDSVNNTVIGENSTETKIDDSNLPADTASDEMDVITPFVAGDERSSRESLNSSKLLHSGEFHDIVVPTNVTRSDTSVVREFQNVLVYFILWNN